MKTLPLTKSTFLAVLASTSALFPLVARAQSTISSVYSGGAGMYTLTGTVTSVLDVFSTTNNTFTFSDGTGSIIAYHVPQATYTATVGDKITITATDSPYQGAPELASPYTITLNSSGVVLGPTVLTIPQFNAAGGGSAATGGTGGAVTPNAEAYVTLNNVFLPFGTTSLNTTTNTSYSLNDAAGNTTTMFAYHSYTNTLAALNAANTQETNSGGTFYSGPLNITGYADVFNGTTEIYPLSITAAAPEPSTYVLSGIGTIAMVFFARRVRMKRQA